MDKKIDIDDLKARMEADWQVTIKTIPCKFKGATLWYDCQRCNGIKADKKQPAYKCSAWIAETFFGDDIF